LADSLAVTIIIIQHTFPILDHKKVTMRLTIAGLPNSIWRQIFSLIVEPLL